MSNPRMATEQTTSVLLYSSMAGIYKEVLVGLFVMSFLFSSCNVDPLTIQPMKPLVELQLKVAVDPSVALTDVGVTMNSEI